MILYVVGFAFDDLGRVALIRKLRPSWQAGKLNGIGGHIEPKEWPVEAMAREFEEETGVCTAGLDWLGVGSMTGADWCVHVFTTVSPKVRYVVSKTDEEVGLYLPEHVRRPDCLENVPALISLCQIKPEAPSMRRPNFVLTY